MRKLRLRWGLGLVGQNQTRKGTFRYPGYEVDLSRMKNIIENSREKIEEVKLGYPKAPEEKQNLNLGGTFLKGRHLAPAYNCSTQKAEAGGSQV